MKAIKKQIKVDDIKPSVKSQAMIEGSLITPVGYADISEVLLVDGYANVLSCEVLKDKVLIDGNAFITVVYVGADGVINSYESQTAFKHSIIMDGVMPSMTAKVKCSLKEIDYSLSDSRAVMMKSVVDMETKIYCTKVKNYISNVNTDSIITKRKSEDIYHLHNEHKDSMKYNAEVRIPQNMPPCKEILYKECFLRPTSVVKDESKAVVEADLMLYMVYLSADSMSPLHYLYETLDVGKIMYIEELEDEDSIDCEVSAKDLGVIISEENPDTIAVEAYLTFNVAITRKESVTYVEDSYSLENKLEMETEAQTISMLECRGQMKSIIRTSVEIPESMPTVARVLFFKAKPVVSSGYCTQDRIIIEGIMLYNSCYASSEKTHSIKGEFPFTTEVQLDGFNEDIKPEIDVKVDYISFDGAGRNIDLKITLCISAKGYKEHQIEGVTNINETEEKVEKIRGMHIYFAGENESYWDIAKKYNTSIDSIEKYNPCEDEVKGKKKKVIIL